MSTITKGSWQDNLAKSTVILDKSAKDKVRAGALLWTGAQVGIEEWQENVDADPSAETFYNEVKDLLGDSRKGDASKIRTVAIAVQEKGLVMGDFSSLNSAYNEARRLTTQAKEEEVEDTAADEAIQSIEAPRTTGKPEGAAAIVLSQGVDEAARLLLDALGADNTPAHRSFLRAVGQEVSGRITAAKKAEATAKAEAAQAKREEKAAERKAAAAALAAKKAAAAAEKKAEAAKNKGTKAPAKKAASAKKAAPVKRTKPEPVDETPDVTEDDDLFDDFDMDEAEETTEVETPKATPVKKAAPVKRAVPVKRG